MKLINIGYQVARAVNTLTKAGSPTRTGKRIINKAIARKVMPMITIHGHKERNTGYGMSISG